MHRDYNGLFLHMLTDDALSALKNPTELVQQMTDKNLQAGCTLVRRVKDTREKILVGAKQVWKH